MRLIKDLSRLRREILWILLGMKPFWSLIKLPKLPIKLRLQFQWVYYWENKVTKGNCRNTTTTKEHGLTIRIVSTSIFSGGPSQKSNKRNWSRGSRFSVKPRLIRPKVKRKKCWGSLLLMNKRISCRLRCGMTHSGTRDKISILICKVILGNIFKN
jgi:hypothetical protein